MRVREENLADSAQIVIVSKIDFVATAKKCPYNQWSGEYASSMRKQDIGAGVRQIHGHFFRTTYRGG